MNVITELTAALQLMTPAPVTLATWAPPAWATTHNLDHGCIYHEHRITRGDHQIDLAQTNRLVMMDGLVAVVSEPDSRIRQRQR